MDPKDNQNGFSARLERFVSGRGYYVVLAVCAVVIGVSVWSLLQKPAPEPEASAARTVVAPVPTAVPDATPEPVLSTPEPTPEPVNAESTPVEEVTVTLEDAEETAAQEAFVLPVQGAVQRPYSVAALAYDETMRDWRTHDGVDLAAEAGEKVSAITSGTVTGVFHDDRYGTTVTIDHGDGLVCTYAGLQEIPTVYEGDTVHAGDTIGAVGETNKCEVAQGTHLHFSAAKNGETISPAEFLPALG